VTYRQEEKRDFQTTSNVLSSSESSDVFIRRDLQSRIKSTHVSYSIPPNIQDATLCTHLGSLLAVLDVIWEFESRSPSWESQLGPI